MDIKKLIDKAQEIESLSRDIKIEKILGDEVSKSTNDKFIDEVRDHLSTLINRNHFCNKLYFKNPIHFYIEKICDCKTHYEDDKSFQMEIFKLWTLYKNEPDFTYKDILGDYVMKEMNIV
jgi:hypothetical protein